ncbi:uncharacterized protein PG986_009380 [Apiospora aurea]|uniref:Uncharacterized protein n=1 Tax=Apiospora aurea TaxID=335848 RepID=A0ABR1Q7W0_9PEZI
MSLLCNRAELISSHPVGDGWRGTVDWKAAGGFRLPHVVSIEGAAMTIHHWQAAASNLSAG